MNKVLRGWSWTVTLGACTLVGAMPASQAPPPLVPCNRLCTASVSTLSTNGATNGQCMTIYNPNPPPGDCGTIGLRVTVQSTSGQCTTGAGGCSGGCSFIVTLDYASTCPSPPSNTTVSASECGTTNSFSGLGYCGSGSGWCQLQSNTYPVSCGSVCNLSYLVSDPGVSSTCTLVGGLTCGNHTCP